MRRVPGTNLYLGDRGDVQDPAAPRRNGIAVVVDLAMEEAPLRLDRERTVIRVPLMDGSGNEPELIRLAIGVVETLLRMDVATLVLCSAGISRTPAIAAAALSRVRGQRMEEALGLLAGLGPADVSPALWASVAACESRDGDS